MSVALTSVVHTLKTNLRGKTPSEVADYLPHSVLIAEICWLTSCESNADSVLEIIVSVFMG